MRASNANVDVLESGYAIVESRDTASRPNEKPKTRTIKNQRVRHPKNQPKAWPTRLPMRIKSKAPPFKQRRTGHPPIQNHSKPGPPAPAAREYESFLNLDAAGREQWNKARRLCFSSPS
jgi:hypothetical protein